MKKLLSLITVLFLGIALVATGCSSGGQNDSNGASKAALMATLGVAEGFVGYFPEAASEATAEDKAGLQEDAQDILSSVEDLQKEIDDNPDEFTDEEKQEIQQSIDNIKAKIQEGMDILATK